MESENVLESKNNQGPTLKDKTAKGLFWGGISGGIQQIIGMLLGLVIARILSPDDYGLVAMLAIFSAVANTFIDSGFSSALINRKTIDYKDYNSVFWFSLFCGCIIYIILFLAAPFISKFYNQPVLTNLSRLLFLTFLFNGMGIAHNAILLKKIMAKQRGIIDIVSVSISGILGIALALNGFAYWGIAIQQVSQSLITTLLRWYFSPWKPSFNFQFSPLKEMFGYSVRLFTTNIFLQITNNLFSTILGRQYGKNETGYYAQGNKWATYGSFFIVSTIGNIAHPVLVEARIDIKRQLNVFRKILRFGSFITFPALLSFAFVGKEFILITIGEKWLNSVIYMQLFCLWGINSFLMTLYTVLILSHEKSRIYMNLTIALLLSQILALYICSPYGIFIMICTYICLCYCFTLGFHFFANKLIGIRIWDVLKDLFPYFSATIAAIVVSWLITLNIENVYLKFTVKCLMVIIIYISLLWFSKSVIVRESFNFLKGKIK